MPHMGVGDDEPAFKAGQQLRLYSCLFCPFAQRARLVLAHLKIPYETVNVKLRDLKPEWFVSNVNRDGTVPVLQLDEKRILSESLIICDYLDVAYKGQLIPSDPYEFAKHKLVMHHFTKYIGLYYKFIGFMAKLSEEEKTEVGKQINAELARFQMELADNNFLGGSSPKYADLMVWPWLERIKYMKAYQGFSLDESLKKLDDYLERMEQVPAVAECLLSPSDHHRFYSSLASGTPDYDF